MTEIMDWLNEGLSNDEVDPQLVKLTILRQKQEWQAEKLAARFTYKTGEALDDNNMKMAAIKRVERAMKALAYLDEQEASLGT